MGKSIKRYFTSYKTSIVLLLTYALTLALATVIEKYGGTPVAKAFVYYSPFIFVLYTLIVINFIAVLLRYNLLKAKKWGFLIVHLSFIVILTGALVTFVFGKEGVIHLREGETTGHMVVQTSKKNRLHELPFQLELEKFTLKRYPGSSSPSSYESTLSVHADGQTRQQVISMNNVLDIKGYRLFQASYDKDEQGSILSVNQDVAGRNITYAGYALLFIGFILCLIGRNTRFRQLLRQLKQIQKQPLLWIGGLLLLSPLALHAQPQEKDLFDIIQERAIDTDHAFRFGALPMQSISGRIEPVNTFASEVLRKLHKADKIGNLNPDQFLLSLICMPEMWMYTPFIACSNKEITFNHDLTENYCSYIEMFDSNGNYKLERELAEAFAKPPAQRTGFEKDLIKLDEQINIFHQLINLRMINIFPLRGDANHKWYAPGDDLSAFTPDDSLFITRVTEEYKERIRNGIQTNAWKSANHSLAEIREYQSKEGTVPAVKEQQIIAELAYNNLKIFDLCKKLYLISGGLLFLFSFVTCSSFPPKVIVRLKNIIAGCIAVTLFIHFAGIALRWYIADYAPWSNSYETMVYLAFITVLGGMFFIRQSTIPLALSTLFGGVILFVSGLNWMNPQISPLVPVLKSPWLMIHVAVIMIAYGFFGISFLIGTTNLVLLRINKTKKMFSIRIKELSIMNEVSLIAGLAFMTVGTFLGAIWANESWGRYWGWDPKETWALITIITYTVATHLRLVRKWDNPFLFNLISVLAFACVLMTYFGVNYLLSGMHSYN